MIDVLVIAAIFYTVGIAIVAFMAFMDDVDKDDGFIYAFGWPVYAVYLVVVGVRWFAVGFSGALYRKVFAPAWARLDATFERRAAKSLMRDIRRAQIGADKVETKAQGYVPGGWMS